MMPHRIKRFVVVPLGWILFLSLNCFAQNTANLNNSGVKATLTFTEPSQALAARMKYQKPVAKGSIVSLGNKPVQLNAKETAPLKMVANAAFKPINQYTLNVTRKAKVGTTILSKPIVQEEAVEFDDSYVVRKSTTINVIDPKKMKQISPTFASYLSRRKTAKKMGVSELDPESRKGLNQLIQQARSFPAGDPIRLAAAKGDQALLDAVLEGKGELTIEDTIVIPKVIPIPVKGIARYPVIKDGRINFKQLKPVSLPVLKELNRVSPPAKLTPVTGLIQKEMTMVPKNPNVPEYNKSGQHQFTGNFLAGFTKGHSWQWERKWKYKSGFFRVTIGGGYGFGLRVPVRAKGELHPTNIYRYDKFDRPETISGRIFVETLDADENFYRSTGLAHSKLFRGNEVVLEYQMGFGYKLRALWKDLAKKPFSGFGINYSQNAKPPWGANCSDCGFHVPIPPEITRTTFNFSVMTGFVQTGFHVSGTGKAFFKIHPMLDGAYRAPVNMRFDQAVFQPFSFRLSPKTPPAGQTQLTRQFGFKLSDLVYRMGMSITPEVRVGVRAGYKSFSRTFATNWIPLNSFKLRMGTLQLYTHEGTRPDYTFTNGKKVFRKIPGEKFDPKKMKQMPKMKIN